MKITAQMLSDAGAGRGPVDDFRRLWPDGVTMSLAVCRQAYQEGFDLDWFAKNLLPPPGLAVYEEAFDTYLVFEVMFNKARKRKPRSRGAVHATVAAPALWTAIRAVSMSERRHRKTAGGR